MAVASIAVPPDAKRDARARVLSGHVGSWPRYTLKQAWGSFEAGTEFRRAPSVRNPKVRYLVNSVACQCSDYAQHGNVCKHVRAVVLWEASQQPAPTAPRARPSYADLFPACPCGDVADSKDGRCSRCASDREWEASRAARLEHFRQEGARIGAALPPFSLNPLAE